MSSRLLLVIALVMGLSSGLAAQQVRVGQPPGDFATAAPGSLQRLAPVPDPPIARAHPTLDLPISGRLAQRGKGQAVALMIVGGAGLITGLLVDESIITIAGAGAAGVGLFLYLR